jgi:hypothetical protein
MVAMVLIMPLPIPIRKNFSNRLRILLELGADADKCTTQAALMPFDLPEEYKPNNQRFTDSVINASTVMAVK